MQTAMVKGDWVALAGLTLIAIVTVLVVAFVNGCAAAPDAKYTAEFERCYQVSGTCEEYLKCWQDNQRANHRPVTGSCKGVITTTDAGHP